MNFEFKLVPLDRKTGKPVFPAGSPTVPTSFVLDLESCNASLAALPEYSAGLDVEVFANVLAEMFGADVYYRGEPVAGLPNEWRREPCYLPGAARYRERKSIKLHASKIALILETADHRALATDGPVSDPQFAAGELKQIYAAAKAIVIACQNGEAKK